MGKKLKQWTFSEITVVYDIKVGRCSQLNEYMKLSEYQRSRSFIDLDPTHSDSIFLTGERGGSVVECRTPEREVGGSKPTAAVLCP